MRSEKLVSINESVFQMLQPEMQIVVKLNGDIVYKNPSAESNFPLPNIFDHLNEEIKQNFFTYCQQLTLLNSMSSKRFFIDNKQMLFKGILDGEFIYFTISEEPPYAMDSKKIDQIAKWSWESLNIGVLAIDKEETVIDCNLPCIEYLGLSLQDHIIGLHYKKIIKESQLLQLIEDIASEIETKEGPIRRYYYNQEFFYLLQAYYHKADQTTYFFISDHTYLHKFENLLIYREQMEQVSHLAAGVAHEIRNPLSVIKGFIQLANHTKRFDQFYDTVMSEINRMNEIIEDFLSVSKKRDDKRAIFYPHEIIKSNISIMQSECLLHGINIEHFFDSEDDRVVEVNDGMIKQVILNLLRNAIEAFHDKPEIENKKIIVNAYHTKDYYQVEFIDNGPGIDADILKQIGKPFFTTKEKGTGIGITMCNKIIQDHGGKFTIDSTIGKGTTISFTLPFAKE